MFRYRLMMGLFVIFFIVFFGFALPCRALESLDPVSTTIHSDADADGLTDEQEQKIYHTDPLRADTDGDGYSDGTEIAHGFSPLAAHVRLDETDTDGDGLSDATEILLHTDLRSRDTDSDTLNDRDEVFLGQDPASATSTTSTVVRTVKVDLGKQQLGYFFNGVKLGTMPVSTGQAKTPTPQGTFTIMRKVPIVHYIGPGYNLPNTKWNLEFKRHFYLHGAYWHNQFGIRTMSHGCVNMAYRDVEKLYAFLQVGDRVEIVGKAQRGKISNPITMPTTIEIKKAVQQIAEQPGSSS